MSDTDVGIHMDELSDILWKSLIEETDTENVKEEFVTAWSTGLLKAHLESMSWFFHKLLVSVIHGKSWALDHPEYMKLRSHIRERMKHTKFDYNVVTRLIIMMLGRKQYRSAILAYDVLWKIPCLKNAPERGPTTQEEFDVFVQQPEKTEACCAFHSACPTAHAHQTVIFNAACKAGDIPGIGLVISHLLLYIPSTNPDARLAMKMCNRDLILGGAALASEHGEFNVVKYIIDTFAYTEDEMRGANHIVLMSNVSVPLKEEDLEEWGWYINRFNVTEEELVRCSAYFEAIKAESKDMAGSLIEKLKNHFYKKD